MTTRDTILDLIAVTTGDRESAERMLHLVETQAYADGFDAGYTTATNTNEMIAEMESDEGWTESAEETDALQDEAMD
jgi:hypothetical protein